MTQYNHIFDGEERVMIISDTQAPYQHKDTLPFLKAVKKLIKPTRVIHIGDLTDQHGLSFFVRNPDLPSISGELDLARPFLKELYRLFPEVTLLSSNHDNRIYRVAEKAGLPMRCMRDLLDIVDAPKGWSMADNVVIDGVFYEHGDKGKGGLQAGLNQAKDNFRSTVVGHHHSLFGIDYYANPEKLIFGMSVGCLLNQKALAFNYAKHSKKKSVIGTGAVVNGFPILIPMMLDKDGNWTGKLPNQIK